MNCKSGDDETCKRRNATSLSYYIASLLVTLEYARIWPDGESFPSCKILLSSGATIIFICANFLLLLSEIAVLTMRCNLELFANIIGVIGMHAVGLVKWCYCIKTNGIIVDMVMTLEKCHVLCQRIDNSEDGYQIYRSQMERARQYSTYFIRGWMITCIYGILHWCANPLFITSWTEMDFTSNHTSTKRNLPYITWYPLDVDNIYNYICLYSMQVIGGLSSAIGIVCYDSLYVTILMIICAQFQYINTILTKTNFDNVSTLEKKLKNCADCHAEIIKFLKMLQSFTGPTMFVQCIETLIGICLVSFQTSAIVVINKETILILWSLFEYFICLNIQLYFFCFYATRLEHLGTQISHSVYSCGWELVNVEKKRESNFKTQSQNHSIYSLVQTIILRAQRPIVLTGGPFYALSLETFRAISTMAVSNSVFLHTVSSANE
ncbi:odorant receptor 13a-like [Pseudomyrmex gracilis]|uniref:odorant receptor 13a-like n=1 Tax=Pseudomyrmex gracilis TaxID=219809 RepID=UPI0009954429|nr:odorant receptor 13a-like [Pseudomyrmex gracilis]